MKIKYNYLIIIFLIIILVGSFAWIIDHTVKKIEGFDDDILLGVFVIVAATIGIIWVSKHMKKSSRFKVSKK